MALHRVKPSRGRLGRPDHGAIFPPVYLSLRRRLSTALDLCGREYEPKTVSTAKFSIPFCVSVAIMEGNVDPDVFTIDKINDQNILGLAKKVKIEVDPKIEEFVPQQRGSRVEIIKTNGEKHQYFVGNPYGEPEVPATLEALRNKFRSLSTRVIPIEKAKKIIDLINRLETLDNVKEITGELVV